jgi:hypothetical protein
MNRRTLLTGALSLGTVKFVASAAGKVSKTAKPPVAPAVMPEPKNTRRLKTEHLEILFDADRGLPYSYSYGGRTLRGDDTAFPLKAIVSLLRPRSYATVYLHPSSVEIQDAEARFHFRAKYGKQVAAEFSLVYRVLGNGVNVSLQTVSEQPNFQLIELALPSLVSLRENDDALAWFAQGREGGSYVKLAKAIAYTFPNEDYFGKISTQVPVGMVGTSDIGCVMEVQAYMDGTLTQIAGSAGSRIATLGTVQTYRVHGGRCYNMNNGGPSVCGNAGTPNLLVEQMPSTQLDFFGCAGEKQPWVDGAKIVRSRAPSIPTQYFSDKLLYIVSGKIKTEPTPRTTFAQSHELVHDVAKLTDGAPQVVFLGGWAYDGQDTGFPSEDKVNASLGTYDDLRKLMTDAQEWNANVSLNVNYDDAYKSSPIFDPAFIARRPDGKIWASRAWDGETSYIVGMAKFMEGGWGDKRIEYTVEHYKIHDAMLIDAMSWFAIRNDWDPNHPASGYVNLVKGKLPLIAKARQLGVNVTSELMRYPMLGKLALTMNGPEERPCPFGGEAVPMAAVIYRGSAIWGNSGDGTYDAAKNLLWNTRPSNWFRADSDRTTIAELYFLVTVPFSKLHQLEVQSYLSDGPKHVLMLANGSSIERDTSKGSYVAVFEGVEIARDDATFCPLDEGRIAFYSRNARQLRYPMPKGWSSHEITARSMHLSGKAEFAVAIVDGFVVVEAPAKVPVVVYQSASRVKDI